MREFLFLLILICLGSLNAVAKKHEGFDIVARGGGVRLQDGMIIQGSTAFGGLQPDYLIDLKDPRLEPLYQFTDEWKKKKGATLFDKIRALQDFLGYKFMPRWDPEDFTYRKLLKKYRKAQEIVPIGAYPESGTGVCREFSILTHIGLERMGIKNWLVYASVEEEQASGDFYYGNHGFVLVEYQGELWIIDSYFPVFNGYRLKDALRAKGIPIEAPRLALRNRKATLYRRVLKIHKFPIYWAPKKIVQKVAVCERMLSRPPR